MKSTVLEQAAKAVETVNSTLARIDGFLAREAEAMEKAENARLRRLELELLRDIIETAGNEAEAELAR